MSTTAEQAMESFTAQWYNTLTTALNLHPEQFQLMQGNAPVGNTSRSIWDYFDDIPPASLTRQYNPSRLNSFARAYGAVLMNLKPQNSSTWRQIMGDYYEVWNTYSKSHTVPDGGLFVMFRSWALSNIPDPGTAQAAITAYSQIVNGLIPTAVDMYVAAKEQYAYNVTSQDVQDAVSRGTRAEFGMNTSTASSDVSHTWAQGKISVAGDFFSAGANASFQAFAAALANASLQVTVSYNTVATIAAGPLSQPRSDFATPDFKPWYNSAALALAYGTPDNTVWNNVPPTWETTFGSKGSLQRLTTAVVIVDGIDIKITSGAALSSSDQKAFEAAASGGFWQVLGVSASGGWSTSVNFTDDGKLQSHISKPAGNPQVLGTLVTPIGEVLGVEPSVKSVQVAAFAQVG